MFVRVFVGAAVRDCDGIQKLMTNRSVIVRAARPKGVVNLVSTLEGVVEPQSTIQCHTGPRGRAGLLSRLVLIQWQTVKLVPGSNTAYKVQIAVVYPLDGLVESFSRVCRSSLRRLLSRSKATAQVCVDLNSWYLGELYRNVRASARKEAWQYFLEQAQTKYGSPDCAKLIDGLIRNTVFVARSMAAYEAMIVRKTHLEDSIVAREQFLRNYNGAGAIDNLNFYF
ncbi:hypothetical protein CFAM422_004219 [Trichoderma lentiforme]|uniref:Uncharacterized protein n=1 Tax=Trichoderma lentiforme TaxID=1567552 RepID=A0A9P5CGJ3_9HYPO|nr:hypothetical protein CFAM422_004219 [Trichoderma lentiforme]